MSPAVPPARTRLLLGADEFEAFFAASPVGMAVMDEHGLFARVNPSLARFLGRDEAWLLGRSPAAVTVPEDRPVSDHIVRRLSTPDHPDRVQKRYLRPDGTVVHGLVTAVPLPREGGHWVLAQIEDVTQRHLAQGELLRLATHDPLTGLPGRRLLRQRLDEALEDARRGEDSRVAVLFLDLDGFKLINDALGHAAGDAVLVQTARRLEDAVRTNDTVGRLAGDELVVVAPGMADLDEAVRLVERIEQSVRRPVPFGDDEVLVTASIGLALCDGATSTVEQLLADADAAMYAAKRRGKQRFEVFDAAMRERAREQVRMQALLRDAAVADRVVVHYQPVVHTVTGRPIGVEALMRLRADDGTVLAPDRFLEVAEQMGVLPQLETRLIAEAAREVQGWRQALGLDLHLSVNVCAARVTPELLPAVEAALAASGLPPDRLTVELTEQTLIGVTEAAQSVLRALRDRGVSLAIDDFGTGWASLTYLRRFPVTALKIDRSFVAGLPGDAEDAVIVAALVDLARHLGLASVVEGVETPEQQAALEALAPDYLQGYLFSRPLPAHEVPAEVLRLASSSVTPA